MKETEVAIHVLRDDDAMDAIEKIELVYTRKEWDAINELLSKGSLWMEVKILDCESEEEDIPSTKVVIE